MLKGEIIRTSVSQWNALLLVVPKKADASGKPKLRVDFRKLNDLTIGNSFPAKYHGNLGSVRKHQIFHNAGLGIRISSDTDG